METIKEEKKADQNAVAELTREGLYKENKWLWEENKKLKEELENTKKEFEQYKQNYNIEKDKQTIFLMTGRRY